MCVYFVTIVRGQVWSEQSEPECLPLALCSYRKEGNQKNVDGVSFFFPCVFFFLFLISGGGGIP